MRAARPVLRFLRAPLRKKGVALEAVLALGAARLVTLLPARYYLGRPSAEPAAPGRGRGDPAEIGRVVAGVAAVVPIRSACLQQALALRWMLGRRGWRPVLHLGLNRNPAARADPKAGQAAHAWLTLDETVVLGGHDLDRYAALGRFC